jgi:hypothetical protein
MKIEELNKICATPNPELCKEIGDKCFLEKFKPSKGICFRCRKKYLTNKMK